ncbi:unnamed protein product [Durusdinium trenchii]|uniref:Uncharacterized protein n=1 Tax=Durusdinium trenchii TaxID=1381693 RepID=A0ABP0NUB1_9DINO
MNLLGDLLHCHIPEADNPEDQDALNMLEDSRLAVERLQDAGYERTKPLADGVWIQTQTGLSDEIGPLKEWLFFLQVNEDLQTLDELKARLEGKWPDLKGEIPVVSWPPSRSRWERILVKL